LQQISTKHYDIVKLATWHTHLF